MARLARRRPLDFWPGFVDALASLLMVMVFVILIFVIGQFVLADAVSGRDRALAQLNAELAALAKTLSLEQTARERAEVKVGELSASLGAAQRESEARGNELLAARDELHAAQDEAKTRREEAARLAADIEALQRLKAELEAEAARLASALDTSERGLKEHQEMSTAAIAQVELLNRQLAAVREQLEQLNAALDAAKAAAKDKDLKIDELGRELNLALAARVKELARYRSEFFGRLQAVLGERKDVQIVGDRFVFSSEVLFPSASDEVSADGMVQLGRLAETLKTLSADMPKDLPWVLQVDGHTDRRPIATPRFPSNWELSTARALAIVKFLHGQGIPPERLAATGYGEFHPLDARSTEEAYARNRRIELKLTSR
ncbi:peptidoglycan -binding protein [Thauera phenylacetica]|uniref:OmpA/MotB domain-containing protein n=1 Tax=Thauera phenylacetica B4P TaxID=1234382 RepID=N6ZXA2_9RHOO|nr:peptidoglycan -binding protein [Thauera phenylacetica]ENO98933.1 OmpA/MotB domain-containing protein [Thauera phenylacetica B4P]MBP7640907.1 peptidoglycan -binding protein [Thauera sp.]